jgi:hypothetical protein
VGVGTSNIAGKLEQRAKDNTIAILDVVDEALSAVTATAVAQSLVVPTTPAKPGQRLSGPGTTTHAMAINASPMTTVGSATLPGSEPYPLDPVMLENQMLRAQVDRLKKEAEAKALAQQKAKTQQSLFFKSF